MQFQFKLTIGRTEFTFTETAETHKEFFEKAHFYTTLPRVGPNGEDDLELRFRETKDGYTYYSLVSPSAKQEMTFGQSKQSPGELFSKDWAPLFGSDRANSESSQDEEQEERPARRQESRRTPSNPPAKQETKREAAPTPPPAKKQAPAQAQDESNVDDIGADLLAQFGIG